MRLNRQRFALGVGFWALAAGTHAQTTPAPATTSAATEQMSSATQPSEATAQQQSTGGDIIVSARRRNERLLDVPVAVAAIDAAAIARYNSDSLAKLTETVPTVQIANYGTVGSGGTFTIRGIGTPASQGGFEQAVSLVIDGVPLSSGRYASLGFFDLQQVEILKGPQALFFGKNSSAGVISLTSANPTDAFEAQARASYEFVGDEAMVQGAVSGPLGDGLSGRVALRYRNLKGWLYNDARPIANPYNAAAPLPGALSDREGERELLGRASLRYVAGNFDATLKAAGQRLTSDGQATQNIGPCPSGRPEVSTAGIIAIDPFAECKPDNHYSDGSPPAATASTLAGYRSDNKQYAILNAAIVSLNANLKLSDGLALTSTTGYVHSDQKSFFGFDDTVYSQNTIFSSLSNNYFSQELRLSSSFDGPLNFMTGAFFQGASTPQFIDLKLNDSTNQALPAPAQCYNPANGRFSCYTQDVRLSGTTTSGFGQLSLKPFPQVEIAGGVRYTHETKHLHEVSVYGRGSFDATTRVIPGSEDPTPGVLQTRYGDSNWSPEATISYHPTHNSTLYAAYRTGYKSGGLVRVSRSRRRCRSRISASPRSGRRGSRQAQKVGSASCGRRRPPIPISSPICRSPRSIPRRSGSRSPTPVS